MVRPGRLRIEAGQRECFSSVRNPDEGQIQAGSLTRGKHRYSRQEAAIGAAHAHRLQALKHMAIGHHPGRTTIATQHHAGALLLSLRQQQNHTVSNGWGIHWQLNRRPSAPGDRRQKGQCQQQTPCQPKGKQGACAMA